MIVTNRTSRRWATGTALLLATVVPSQASAHHIWCPQSNFAEPPVCPIGTVQTTDWRMLSGGTVLTFSSYQGAKNYVLGMFTSPHVLVSANADHLPTVRRIRGEFQFPNGGEVSCANPVQPLQDFQIEANCEARYHIEVPSGNNNPDLGSCSSGSTGGGGPGGDFGCGNPINAATGNKYQIETDYSSAIPDGVAFVRTYNSAEIRDRGMGPGWTHNYARRLTPVYGGEVPPTAPPLAQSVKSSDYTTQQAACISGWEEIKGRVMGSANISAVWTGTSCQITGVASSVYQSNTPGTQIGWMVNRPDGRAYKFTGSPYTAAGYVTGKLEIDGAGYKYTEDDVVELYDSTGQLTSITARSGIQQVLSYTGGKLTKVTDSYGRELNFAYDAQDRLAQVTDPDGKLYGYSYTAGNLASLTWPDGSTRIYHYEDSRFPSALTGITDEGGDRFATWTYDSSGKATSSAHAGGVESTSMTFGSGSTLITNANGASWSYAFSKASGVNRLTSVTRNCTGCQQATRTRTYDANGYADLVTDFNGNVTDYDYDSRGLETRRIEAKGTALEREITTQWHTTFRVPTQIDEPGRRTTYTYDGQGNRLSKTVTDLSTNVSRTTTWTYTSLGMIDTVNGPRTDVSDVIDYDYDTAGNLIRITDALGHITEITQHDAHGNPTRIVDPNGVVTVLTYDLRQRLLTRTVSPAGGPPSAVTAFAYDDVGQLQKITLPDGSYLAYFYDAAHRLTDITDEVSAGGAIIGNRIHYTLDLLGNRTNEDLYDPSGALKRAQSSVFNQLGWLQRIRNAAAQTTDEYGYDAEGNRTSRIEAGSFTTTYAFDALNRELKVTDVANGDTQYGFNSLSQLVSVTDPKNLTTSYAVNAFGDVTQQVSPDTGTTSFTYDAAGNRVTKTDARNVTATFTYDALNRLTDIDYAGSAEDVKYLYDGINYLSPTANGVGRLTGVVDESGTTTLAYDHKGNIISESRVMGGATYLTSYTYDAADRLVGITYPTGRSVAYVRNALGRVTSVTTTKGAVTQTVASNIQYLPFGPITSFTLGNGIAVSRSFDQNYRLSEYEDAGVQHVRLYYDLRDNIEAIENVNQTERSETFTYDALSRLQHAEGVYGSFGYTYDGVGNRLSEDRNGAMSTYSYPLTSSRLASISGPDATSFNYDGAGNTLSGGGLSLSYNNANRVSSATGAGGSIQNAYDFANRRVAKTSATGETNFHYDPQGHLLAETSPTSPLQHEYVWLEGVPLYVAGVEVRPESVLDNDGTTQTGTWSVTHAANEYGANHLTHAPTGSAGATIVDDEDVTSISVSGPWVPTPCDGIAIRSGCQGTRVSVSYTNALAVGSFVWNVPLASAGRYEVYARWVSTSSTAENAKYLIHNIYGTSTRTANQRTNSGKWVSLGQYSFNAGTAQIELSNAGNGPVIADAVRMVQVAGPSASLTREYAKWSAPDALKYSVSARWPAKSTYSPAATYVVRHSAGMTYLSKNQQAAGGVWKSLGTFTFTSDPGQGVYLLADPDYLVAADAVRFVPDAVNAYTNRAGYFHTSHLGTPVKVTAQDKGGIWDATYEPLGKVSPLTAAIAQSLRFPGQYFDAETGLHQNWFRDYDPSIGRYLQPDPLGILEGDRNSYAYVDNDPINFTDPEGMKRRAPPRRPPPPPRMSKNQWNQDLMEKASDFMDEVASQSGFDNYSDLPKPTCKWVCPTPPPANGVCTANDPPPLVPGIPPRQAGGPFMTAPGDSGGCVCVR